MKKYSCDFETTTNKTDVRVWLWGVVDIDTLEFYHGTDIALFFQFMKKHFGKYYFHNLKFDGEFLLSFAMRKLKMRYSKSKETNTFDVVISGTGQFYKIEFTFFSYGTFRVYASVFDSLKKLPFSVHDLAISFNLPIRKGEIDYNLPRPLGYKVTYDELEYLKNDCEIVARALKIQYDNDLVKMTIGSDALSTFKKMFKKFDEVFPVLPLEIDSDIRKSLRGGFTYVNKIYQNKEISEGVVYDVNSMYPWAMKYKPMPCGIPLFFEGEYEYDSMYPLYIQHIFIDFEIKENRIPCIQIKNNRFYNDREYLEKSDCSVEMWLTCVDLELIKEQYNILDIQYVNGWKFKKIEHVFDEYIDKYMAIKKSSSGAIKQLAKLLLNNLYGKFTTNPDKTGKIPYLENEIVRYKMNEEKEISQPVYTAVGIFITSYARERIIKSAQKEFKRFLYADTDSLHLIGNDKPNILIDDNELGYFKLESKFKKAKYIRAKTYIEVEERKKYFIYNGINYVYKHDYNNIKCAGMPKNLKECISFDDFKIGLTLTGKLVPKKFIGGVILEDYPFTIK